MRPLNKGEAPYVKISDYAEALPYLEERIGLYCSYCGFPIKHVPEVEHISAKSEGGDRTAWSNLLLGCKYCNTRKSKKVTPLNKNAYLWPDQYNTAIAYQYTDSIPKVNEETLIQLDPSGEYLKKAENLFGLLALDHIPGPGEKDRRFQSRFEVYTTAMNTLQHWKKMRTSKEDTVRPFLDTTIELAKYSGFFSIWTMVFTDEPVILRALLDAFPGTDRTYFDENGLPNTLLCKPKED